MPKEEKVEQVKQKLSLAIIKIRERRRGHHVGGEINERKGAPARSGPIMDLPIGFVGKFEEGVL